MSTPATITRGEFQNSLLGEVTEEQDTNRNLNPSQSNTNENISPILSIRGESFDSLLGESNNVSTTTTHCSQHPLPYTSPAISSRGESFDSLLRESTNVSHKIYSSHKHYLSSVSKISTRGETSNSLLGEMANNEGSFHEAIEAIINENNESLGLLLHEAIETTKESNKLSKDEAPSTSGESSGSLLGEKGSDKPNKSKELPFIKNVGFVNKKWTEILVDNEAESDEMDRDEIKKAIIQMAKREEHNPLDNWTDRFIRVNHKTYVTVEVVKDRNGRMMYMRPFRCTSCDHTNRETKNQLRSGNLHTQ